MASIVSNMPANRDKTAFKRGIRLSLPFLKNKNVAGLIISQRKADGGGISEQHSEGNEDAGIDACSEALIRAINAKDARAVSAAFKDAWQILESTEPQEADESEAPSPHTYDAQNAAAAKNRS